VYRKNFLASIVPVIVNTVLNEHHLVTDIVAFVSKGDFPRSRLGEKQRGRILAAWVTRKMRTIAQVAIRDPDAGMGLGGGMEDSPGGIRTSSLRHSSLLSGPPIQMGTPKDPTSMGIPPYKTMIPEEGADTLTKETSRSNTYPNDVTPTLVSTAHGFNPMDPPDINYSPIDSNPFQEEVGFDSIAGQDSRTNPYIPQPLSLRSSISSKGPSREVSPTQTTGLNKPDGNGSPTQQQYLSLNLDMDEWDTMGVHGQGYRGGLRVANQGDDDRH